MGYPAAPAPPAKKKILGMSGGVFAGVIVAVVLLCCAAPITAFVIFFNRVADAIGEPTAEITSCRISDGSVIANAQVEYELTNPGPNARSFQVEIEVVDSSGDRIATINDFVPTVRAGSTVSEEAVLILRESGGKECRIASIK